MGKSKGRPRRGRLADMTIPPPQDCRYELPPEEDLEEFTHLIDVGVDHRLGVRQVFLRGRSDVVYFAVWQSVRLAGRWETVARIDCSHGEVHRHQFTREGGNQRTTLEVIPVDRGQEVVERWVVPATDLMHNGWEDNVRRWHGDSQ